MPEGESVYEPPQIYTGLNEQHGVAWVEKGWGVQTSEEFPEQLRTLNLDDKISGILTEEMVKGNKEIVIFDIGSGSDGILIKSFFNVEEFPKLHTLLGEQSGLSVRIVGVTAAQEEQVQGQLLEKNERKFGDDQIVKSNLIVENYAYTITRAHRLKSFMQMAKVEFVNASFSTFGIGYLTPANFEQCLLDLVEKLSDGGEFYGISWDAVPAGAIRSPFGGTFIMRGGLPENHPLHKVFGGFSSNESFTKFYEQTAKNQVESHLSAIEYCLESVLVSIDQVRNILSGTNVLPIPAFVHEIHRYTSEKQQQNIRTHIRLLSWIYPSLSDFSWDGKTSVLDEIRRCRDRKFSESKDSQINNLNRWNNRKGSYNESEKAEQSVWKYIKSKYSTQFRDEVVRQKELFNGKIKDSAWEDIKKHVSEQNADTISRFWDWHSILWKLQQLVIAKQAIKTTEMKLAAIDRLAIQDNLLIHASKLPGGHGLNIYIKKSKPASVDVPEI